MDSSSKPIDITSKFQKLSNAHWEGLRVEIAKHGYGLRVSDHKSAKLASAAPLSGTLSMPTATRLAYSITRPDMEVAIRSILSDHEYEVYTGIARHAADYDNGCGLVLDFLRFDAHRLVVVKLYPAAAPADELNALAQLVVQGLQTMCFLHRLGIAHLDLHKDNFIHDGALYWLVDFGESYLFDHDPTRTPIATGNVMMKPEWGPPETRMPGSVFSPFPLDVYRFGQTLEPSIPAQHREHASMKQLLSFAEVLQTADPSQRPTAAQALARLRRTFPSWSRHMRMPPRKGVRTTVAGVVRRVMKLLRGPIRVGRRLKRRAIRPHDGQSNS